MSELAEGLWSKNQKNQQRLELVFSGTTILVTIPPSTLSELGLPAPSNAIQTMLMQDGHFVGHKRRYDGGHPIWLAGGSTIELDDEQGKLLRTVGLGDDRGAAA